MIPLKKYSSALKQLRSLQALSFQGPLLAAGKRLFFHNPLNLCVVFVSQGAGLFLQQPFFLV
jgi:hypothetical protein